MSPSKPYLLRALHEWIADNGLTPHLIVDANAPGLDVPVAAGADGKLVLNVGPDATRNLEMGNESVSFNARFSGTAQTVFLPISAIIAIYARENGQGMMFPSEEDVMADDSDPKSKSEKNDIPHLRVIK